MNEIRLLPPRRERLLTGRSLAMAVFLHVAAVGALAARPPEPAREVVQTYAIDLAFPPPEALGMARPAESGSSAPESLTDEAVAIRTPPKEREREERPESRRREEKEPEPAPERKPAPKSSSAGEGKGRSSGGEQAVATGANAAKATLQGEGLNVHMSGAEFPYPGYLQNIIVQINRHFRRPAGSRTEEAEVVFWIERDGTVRELEVGRGGAGYAFRSAAMEAVEQAASRGLFGPLPQGFPGDRLLVSFEFRPAR